MNGVAELSATLARAPNLDGSVLLPDFLALAAGFGTDRGWASGYFNASLDVTFGDFLLLSENFGLSSEAAAVPERNRRASDIPPSSKRDAA